MPDGQIDKQTNRQADHWKQDTVPIEASRKMKENMTM